FARAALVLLLVLAPRAAFAHGEKTAYLEIVETAPGDAVAIWKTPTPSREAMPAFTGACTATEAAMPAARSQSVAQLHVRCARSLHGETIRVDGIGITVRTVVVRVVFADGSTHSEVLAAGRKELTLPSGSGAGEVFARFAQLGVVHILSGIDHLLFLLALL